MCAGSYAGTYSGTANGVVIATLHADGTLETRFVTGGIEATGVVAESGAITGSGDGIYFDGAIAFSSCAMSGDWANTATGLAGTWQMARQ